MQVTPLPPVPVVTGAVPQEAVAKILPQVQGQSAAPITQRAVDPSNKSERGNRSRSNNDRAKGGDTTPENRGHNVNVRV